MDNETAQSEGEHKWLWGTVHVDKNGQAYCNQLGDTLQLRSAEEFTKLPGIHQCRRCSKLLGLEPHWREDMHTLSRKQRGLLNEISKRTQGKERWCPVAELCTNKTSSGWTSLHRSIRRLVARGLIEKKVNKQNRALVRLSSKGRTVYLAESSLSGQID